MRCRRGFLIWMMMIVLILLGVFSLLAGRLLTASFRLTQESQERQTQAMRFDAMLNRLRADVWNARQIKASPQTLGLTMASGEQVSWQVEGPAVRRVEGRNRDQWTRLDAKLTFEGRAAMVVVKMEEGPVRRTDEVALMSQAMLAGRGQP